MSNQCRDVRGDSPGLRVFAASAIVVGLMLATAPAALAQVRLLVGTAPATFAQNDPSLDAPARDDPGLRTGGLQDDDNAQRPPTIRAVAPLIRTAASHALKCAYDLFFQASNRDCYRSQFA